MKKIIIFSFLIVVIVFTFIIGNIEHTTIFNGVLVENSVKVDIKITRTNFDELFNKISKDMIVEGEGVNYRYIFSGKFFKMNGYYAAPIRRINDAGLAAQGYLFFDDKMDNIVIETKKEKIYSGDEDFVNTITNKDIYE